MGYYDQTSEIPLSGPGIKRRPVGNYAQGEYKDAVNVMLDPTGALVSRPPIYTVPSKVSWSQQQKIIGQVRDYIITVTSGSAGVLLATNTAQTISATFNAGSLPAPVEFGLAPFYATIEWVQTYNNKVYAVVQYHYKDGTDFWFSYYVYEINSVDSSVSNIVAYTGAMPNVKITLEGKYRYQANSLSAGYFVNCFMFRDRMWVVNDNGIYFSKVANPLIWAAPDGGFILFPDENIKWVLPFKDILYVFCDSAIYYITYNVDPNDSNDIRKVLVTDEFGADHAAVHSNAIYFMKNDYIYTLTGNNVERVMEFGLDDSFTSGLVSADRSRYKLVSFKDHLYLVRQSVQGPNPVTPQYFNGKLNAGYFSDARVYMINMNFGFMSELVYVDGYAGDEAFGGVTDKYAHPVDLMVNAFEADSNNSQVLFFLNKGTIRQSAATPTIAFAGSSLSFMVTNEKEYDSSYDTMDLRPYASGYVANPKNVIPSMAVTIEDFVPDGNKLMVKRFKNWLAEGKFPGLHSTSPDSSSIKMDVAYDNGNYVNISTIFDSNVIGSESKRSLNPVRVGLNQKARSISLKFYRSVYIDELVAVGTQNKNFSFMFTMMGIVWQATKRGPKYRNNPTLDANNTLN